MNRELLTWYLSLGPDERKAIKNKASESPVLLRLLLFLDNCREKNFSTLSAVRALYPEEMDRTAFAKLRNRFFKIRKELLSQKVNSQDNAQSKLMVHPLEHRYFELREQVRSREADIALRGLKELTKECHKLNLFELYPLVLQERIYGLLLQNDHLKVNEILRELEEAGDVQHAWNKMYLMYRQAFEQHFKHTGFEEVQLILKRMSILSREYSKWPRFRLAYLFAFLTFETAHPRTRPQVAGKHFKQIEELLESHPEMPVYYFGINYRIHTLYQIEQFRVNYHFIQGNFETAYESFLRNWDRIHSGALNRPIAENEYKNRIKLELITQRYQQALHTVQDLIQFQKSSGLTENIPTSYSELALIYIYAFPTILPKNTELLFKYLDEKLKIDAHQTGKDSRGYAETITTRAALLLICKKYKQAFQDIQHPAVPNYYGNEIYPIIQTLYEFPLSSKNLSKERLAANLNIFFEEMTKKSRTIQDPLSQHIVQFVLKMINYFREKGF